MLYCGSYWVSPLYDTLAAWLSSADRFLELAAVTLDLCSETSAYQINTHKVTWICVNRTSTCTTLRLWMLPSQSHDTAKRWQIATWHDMTWREQTLVLSQRTQGYQQVKILCKDAMQTCQQALCMSCCIQQLPQQYAEGMQAEFVCPGATIVSMP